MKFEKEPLSIEAQVQKLLGRGMIGDPALMAERLEVVSYYRLSGYAYPFRQTETKEGVKKPTEDGQFIEGTQFETVWRRYTFDRQLRLLLMDALERFEVAFRTQLAHHHSLQYGPFGYATTPASRPKLKPSAFAEFFSIVLEELARSKEPYVKHFYEKYGDEHNVPPLWEAVGIMTFGTLVTFYKATTHQVKKAVASTFGVPDTVMESWLLTLNTVRNICAHHARLWNRELGNKPLIPREEDYPEWHTPVNVGNNRVFGILTVAKHCMNRIAPQSRWPDRLQALLCDYPDIPRGDMGFPENWEECPIWVQRGGEEFTNPRKIEHGS